MIGGATTLRHGDLEQIMESSWVFLLPLLWNRRAITLMTSEMPSSSEILKLDLNLQAWQNENVWRGMSFRNNIASGI